MCDANVYIFKDGKEELFLENVDVVKPENGSVLVKNLFGEQKVFQGTLKEISLLRRRIVLEKK